MILMPPTPERDLPDKIPWLHVGGHAVRGAAYGFGGFVLGDLSIKNVPSTLSDFHQNFGEGMLHAAGDLGLLLTAAYVLKGSLTNLGIGAAESYYNVTGGGRSRRMRRTSDRSPRQFV